MTATRRSLKFVLSRTKIHNAENQKDHTRVLYLDSDTSRQRIDAYITEWLSELSSRLALDPEREQELRKSLAERAQGMFLWVSPQASQGRLAWTSLGNGEDDNGGVITRRDEAKPLF
jgi:hypothetical protein